MKRKTLSLTLALIALLLSLLAGIILVRVATHPESEPPRAAGASEELWTQTPPPSPPASPSPTPTSRPTAPPTQPPTTGHTTRTPTLVPTTIPQPTPDLALQREEITFHQLLCGDGQGFDPLENKIGKENARLRFDISTATTIHAPIGYQPRIGLRVTGVTSGKAYFIPYSTQWGLEGGNSWLRPGCSTTSWEVSGSWATFEIQAADIPLPGGATIEIQPALEQCGPDRDEEGVVSGCTCEWWYSPQAYMAVLH